MGDCLKNYIFTLFPCRASNCRWALNEKCMCGNVAKRTKLARLIEEHEQLLLESQAKVIRVNLFTALDVQIALNDVLRCKTDPKVIKTIIEDVGEVLEAFRKMRQERDL